ncbi:MAG: 3-deoxy-manno-octulosonate cytidylyltransferase [Bacteroidales bacterium]|nr:3-deoxy-manno-octulosonate cytidylyltransferase [Bacteroidales bacterium]
MEQKHDNILGLIPARYASSRFPGKPLADIGGKPMIQRVYEQSCKVLPYVYVATDDERIASAVRNFGGRVVMTATTHQSGTDRCAEALAKVEAELGHQFHAVINIQGDEPFISPVQIELLASAFADAATEIATLVKVADNQQDLFNPNKPKVVVSAQGKALYFSRSPIPYLRGADEKEWHEKHRFYNHIGLYGYRADILNKITKLERGTLEKCESLEQLRWLENGYSIAVLETQLESLSIDTPDDLEELKRRGLV